MKISDLEQILTELKTKHGDVPVAVQTLSHTWDPEPEIRENHYSEKYVLLNP